METNIISFVFVGLFALMMGYLTYFNIAEAGDVVKNPYNKMIDSQADKVIRGNILASDGSVLATTKVDADGNETREYPYGSTFSHVVGLASAKTGLEGSQNFYLLSKPENIFEQISKDATGTKFVGDTVVTTLVPELQKAADKALGNNKGAVIVMEPSTGKILAMVSKPDYDPNAAVTEYSKWLEYDSSDSVLLNRATQGLYPPGSTFKILTALEYVRENSDYDSYTYNCNGSAYVDGGTTIPCNNNKAHGHETLKTAFANSCNSAFSTLGLKLNKSEFKNTCESFLFNNDLPVEIEHNSSSMTINADSGISEVQETSIGQGKTMMSPLHNLMITSTIANNGKMMTPYLVDAVKDSNDNVVEQKSPTVYKDNLVSASEAATIKKYMRAVVTNGTGTAFRNASYEVAGKTGSAQYDNSSNYHSWFVGFAPYDNPKVAICVVLEGGFKNVSSAQYIAKPVLDEYFKLNGK